MVIIKNFFFLTNNSSVSDKASRALISRDKVSNFLWWLLLPGFAFIFMSCKSDDYKHISDQSNRPQIDWPANFEPENASFYIHNSIVIDAPKQVIWKNLVDAENWPAWYVGAKEVKIENNRELSQGSVFYWQTMDLQLKSTVIKFEPYSQLAWFTEHTFIEGYHAWAFVETEQGILVICDESQNGSLTFLEKIFEPNNLRILHDIWLAELKNRSELSESNL